MQLNLVIVQLQEGSALGYNVVCKLLDVIVGSQLLLQLGKDIQAQYLIVAVGLLVVLGLYYF